MRIINTLLLKLTLVLVSLLVLNGCIPMTTKGEEFPGMYRESPKSILILPPMNESTAADAKEYYSTTLQEPLSFFGYYTLPYQVTSDILQAEGIYDAELLKDIPLGKFKEYFGADAVLFTTIKKWDLSYIVIASTLTVSIDARLKSTTTNQDLWEYNGTVVIDLSGGAGGGGAGGLIAKMVIAAINTAMVDYVPYAKQANYKALQAIPFGEYHKHHKLDDKQQVVDLTPKAK